MGKQTSSERQPKSLPKEYPLTLSKDNCLSLSKANQNRKILIWAVTAVFLLFIIIIIVYADKGILPEPISLIYSYVWGDKLAHFVLIGLLAFFVNLSLSARLVKIYSRPMLLGSFLVAIAVIIEEFSQLLISGRNFSLLDLTFDFLGIAAASWLISLVCLSPQNARLR